MQETVKAAASYFYANRSVFDAGRLLFQGFAAETQISNEIGGTDMRTTKFNMKDFGLRLRKLRQACGLTQEEFCDSGSAIPITGRSKPVPGPDRWS